MAIALVKKSPATTSPSVGGAGTSTNALAFATNVTSGNLVVVTLARWREAAGTLAAATISDTAGNTWYKDSESISTRDGVTVWHCYANSTATMSITAAFTDSAYWAITAYEFSGAATGLTAGASGHHEGAGESTAATSGEVAVTGNHAYVGVVEYDAASTCAEGAGWTLGHEDESWTYTSSSDIYQISSGSKTASWTLGASDRWAACVVAFAEAVAAGGVVPTDQYFRQMRA
jgi:hypothetical protein